ncbi:site-specific DNA-methyltransferase [Methylocapsa palsarum]|uniref:Methyltransferase n=1 Tax=Methylocapsa palsarum TaxID=1612308 RepID=A0A1I4CYZ2_9HYPH|nr:DNA methyltransferase [Methylocapsa palsarum]SFK85437.1 DNA modification methylase [Methylocapsa palsarum]
MPKSGSSRSRNNNGVFSRIAVEALVANPQNPRVHNRLQVRAIAQSIKSFGFNAPILIDSTNRVVAGHGRLEAAKLLKLSTVPVIRLGHLTEAQTQAYMLADNKLTDRSSWDDRKLAMVLKELSDLSVEFQIEATGFEAPEIDLRIQSLEPSEDTDAADEFEPLDGPRVSRQGDIWLLGDHRLMCGDALDSHAYGALLGVEKAAAVFTDPPYNVQIKGNVTGKGRKRHREFPMASGEMSKQEFDCFLADAFRLVTSHSTDHATFFACMDWRHVQEITSAIQSVDCELLNICVWVKTNGGMGSLYRSRHELVFVFGKDGEKHVNNVQLGRHGRNRTNVWNYPGMNSFARNGRKRALDLHPTVKPISMVADAILDVTRRGDIILDPFCGSGTTILAAERVGRRAYAIELDPGHVDTTIARWRKLTQRNVVHADGKSVDDIRAERLGEKGDQ